MLKVVFFLQGVKCRQIAKKKTLSGTDPFPSAFCGKPRKKGGFVCYGESPFSETWQCEMQKGSGNLQKALSLMLRAHLHVPVWAIQSPAQMSGFP